MLGVLHRQKQNGRLILKDESFDEHQIDWFKGQIIGVLSPERDTQLGALLKSEGLLSEARIEVLARRYLKSSTEEPFGTWLLHQGLLKRQQLEAILRNQAIQRLDRIENRRSLELEFIEEQFGTASTPLALSASDFLHGRRRGLARMGATSRSEALSGSPISSPNITPKFVEPTQDSRRKPAARRFLLGQMAIATAKNEEELRRLLRQHSLELHPDRAPASDREEVQQHFAKLSESYHLRLDELRRRCG